MPETTTTVFKGSTIGDGFDVVLSHAPLTGEVVTVNFSIPQGLVLSYNGTSITSLSFTDTNWNVPDLVTVTDPQDAIVVGQYTTQYRLHDHHQHDREPGLALRGHRIAEPPRHGG